MRVAVLQQLHRARVVHDRRAERARVDDVLQRQPRVVGGAVVVEQAAVEPVALEPRLELAEARRAHRAVQLRRRELRQPVVDPQADVEHEEARLVVLVDRQQELERPHQVRRHLHEQRALVGALEHQPELRVLEVAEAAVHQLRRLGRRARREVGLLDERHLEPAQRRVARDARAGDAAADDEQVERLRAEPRERRPPVCARGRQGSSSFLLDRRREPRRAAPRAARRRPRVGASVMRSVPFCVFGKAMTSRSESAPHRSIASRSMPNAMPPCGGGPYLNASSRKPNLARTSSSVIPSAREHLGLHLALDGYGSSRRRSRSR